MYIHVPVSVSVLVVCVVVEQSWNDGSKGGHTQRRHHVTTLKQIRMIAHLRWTQTDSSMYMYMYIYSMYIMMLCISTLLCTL